MSIKFVNRVKCGNFTFFFFFSKTKLIKWYPTVWYYRMYDIFYFRFLLAKDSFKMVFFSSFGHKPVKNLEFIVEPVVIARLCRKLRIRDDDYTISAFWDFFDTYRRRCILRRVDFVPENLRTRVFKYALWDNPRAYRVFSQRPVFCTVHQSLVHQNHIRLCEEKVHRRHSSAFMCDHLKP